MNKCMNNSSSWKEVLVLDWNALGSSYYHSYTTASFHRRAWNDSFCFTIIFATTMTTMLQGIETPNT